MAYTPFKMKGSPMQRNFGIGSPMKADPNKKSGKKSSSDDDWAFDKGAKFHHSKGAISGIHRGGFGPTNKKGKTPSQIQSYTKGFAESLTRQGFTESEINTMWEDRGAEGPYKK